MSDFYDDEIELEEELLHSQYGFGYHLYHETYGPSNLLFAEKNK